MTGTAAEWNTYNLMQQISPTGKLEKEMAGTVEVTELPEALGSPWRDKTAVGVACYTDGTLVLPTDGKGPCVEDRRVPRFDEVERPQHYNSGKVEAIEAIKASMSHEEYLGYLKGNTIKYLWRYRYKGKPLQDLNKAQWYLNKLKEEHKCPA